MWNEFLAYWTRDITPAGAVTQTVAYLLFATAGGFGGWALRGANEERKRKRADRARQLDIIRRGPRV